MIKERLVRIVLWFIAGAVIANIIGVFVMGIFGQEFFNTYGEALIYPLMFIPAMIYNYRKSRTGKFFGAASMDLDNDNYSPYNLGICAVLVSVATLACATIFDAVTEILPEMPQFLKDAMSSLMDGPFWLSLLCVSIFAPLFEEWLCRGTVLRGLLGTMKNPYWAIALSALFFALIHLNPWQGIPAFALGCLFGWVYYKTGSLKLTMLMHCVNNTFSLIMSKIPAFENAESFMDLFEGKMGLYWLIYAACIGILFYCVKAFSKIDEKVLCNRESI